MCSSLRRSTATSSCTSLRCVCLVLHHAICSPSLGPAAIAVTYLPSHHRLLLGAHRQERLDPQRALPQGAMRRCQNSSGFISAMQTRPFDDTILEAASYLDYHITDFRSRYGLAQCPMLFSRKTASTRSSTTRRQRSPSRLVAVALARL